MLHLLLFLLGALERAFEAMLKELSNGRRGVDLTGGVSAVSDGTLKLSHGAADTTSAMAPKPHQDEKSTTCHCGRQPKRRHHLAHRIKHATRQPVRPTLTRLRLISGYQVRIAFPARPQ